MNIALIGCGRVAIHHCNAILKQSKLKLKFVCDINKQKAEYLGKRFNIPHFVNYHEMLSEHSNEIDIVAINTPSGMHFDHSKDIMQNYKKHLIVEKPIFMKPAQVKQIYKLGKKYNKKIFPIFQNRYNRAIKRVKKAIINNEIGKINIMNVRVRWCRPQRYYDLSNWRGTFSHDGGALTNQGIHHIDLIRYLVGEPKEVYCKMKTFGAKIEVEDTAIATMVFKNGAIGTLEITTSARPIDYEASISLIGSKGLIQIGGIAVNKLQIFSTNEKECQKYSDDYSDLDDLGKVYGRGHYEIYKFIAKFFYENKVFPINEIDCYNSIKFLNSFYKSNESNEIIKISSKFESNKLGKKNNKISKLYTTKPL
jgi:UDP-N-acetyl-2-amino-2-deoxyglucuronate dehydrogenase